jgi:hypothetical protein
LAPPQVRGPFRSSGGASDASVPQRSTAVGWRSALAGVVASGLTSGLRPNPSAKAGGHLRERNVAERSAIASSAATVRTLWRSPRRDDRSSPFAQLDATLRRPPSGLVALAVSGPISFVAGRIAVEHRDQAPFSSSVCGGQDRGVRQCERQAPSVRLPGARLLGG